MDDVTTTRIPSHGVLDKDDEDDDTDDDDEDVKSDIPTME